MRQRHSRPSDERGTALVMAIGITVALVIVLAAMVDYSSARLASRASSSDQAYALAESGINDALSSLFNGTKQQAGGGNDAADSDYLRSRTTTLSTGTVTWSGTLAGNLWTITSVGSAKKIKRRLIRSVLITLRPGDEAKGRIIDLSVGPKSD